MITLELTPRQAAVLHTILGNVAGPQDSGRGEADAVCRQLSDCKDEWRHELANIALDWDCINTIRFESKTTIDEVGNVIPR